MGVTTQHQHHDYSEAARHELANDIDVIARKAAFDADRHAKNAAALLDKHHEHPHASEYLTEAQATRDTGLRKLAKSTQARLLAEQLRAAPSQPRPAAGGLSAEVCAQLLERLAQEANARTLLPETIDTFLDLWVATAVDDNQRQSLFNDLCEAVALRDGLDSKSIDYRTATDITGMNAEERALDMAHEKVFCAVDALIHPVTHAHDRNGNAA